MSGAQANNGQGGSENTGSNRDYPFDGKSGPPANADPPNDGGENPNDSDGVFGANSIRKQASATLRMIARAVHGGWVDPSQRAHYCEVLGKAIDDKNTSLRDKATCLTAIEKCFHDDRQFALQIMDRTRGVQEVIVDESDTLRLIDATANRETVDKIDAELFGETG
jgi:hypothetical protein